MSLLTIAECQSSSCNDASFDEWNCAYEQEISILAVKNTSVNREKRSRTLGWLSCIPSSSEAAKGTSQTQKNFICCSAFLRACAFAKGSGFIAVCLIELQNRCYILCILQRQKKHRQH